MNLSLKNKTTKKKVFFESFDVAKNKFYEVSGNCGFGICKTGSENESKQENKKNPLERH